MCDGPETGKAPRRTGLGTVGSLREVDPTALGGKDFGCQRGELRVAEIG